MDGVVSEWQVMFILIQIVQFVSFYICNGRMLKGGKLLLAGNFLWDPFGSNGSWELCKYSTDTHGKIKV